MNYEAPEARLPWAIRLLPFLIAALTSIKLCLLASPDLVASYPFHRPDSFDWILNGLYYRERASGGYTGFAMTIRQPLLPAVVAFSFILGFPALVVVTLQLALAALTLGIDSMLKTLGTSAGIRIGTILCFSALYSLHHYSYYVMADLLCIAGIYWSIAFFLDGFTRPKAKLKPFLIGALISGIASLAQLYGLFPAFAAVALCILQAAYRRRGSELFPALAALFVCLIPQAAWMLLRLSLFGSIWASGVTQFGYLQLSFANAGFYGHVLTVYLFPLLAFSVLLLPLVRHSPRFGSTALGLIYLLGLTLAFLAFCFFYQVPDSRFSWTFVPLIYVLVLSTLSLSSKELTGYYSAAVAATILYFASVPLSSFDAPRLGEYLDILRNPKAVMEKNLIPELVGSASIDRYSNTDCFSWSESRQEFKVADHCRTLPVHMYVNDSLAAYQTILRRNGEAADQVLD